MDEFECSICGQTCQESSEAEREKSQPVCDNCYKNLRRNSQGTYELKRRRSFLSDNLFSKSCLEVLPRSCSYSDFGCKYGAVISQLIPHEQRCLFQYVFCPDSECCERLLLRDITKHLTIDHEICAEKEALKNSPSFVDNCLWTCEERDFQARNFDITWPVSVWKAHGEVFFSMLKKRHVDNLWYAWIYILSASEDLASEFRCKITAQNPAKSLSYAYSGKVHTLQRNDRFIMKSPNILALKDEFVSDLVLVKPTEESELPEIHSQVERKPNIKYLLPVSYSVHKTAKSE